MNGKQLFCLSLIILSVAMGMHWFKNRPKVKKKPNNRPRVALNLDDLQVQDKQPDSEEGGAEDSGEVDPGGDSGGEDSGEGGEPDPTEEGSPDNPEDGQDPPLASDTAVAVASGAEGLPPELNDPVILELRAIARNPFEVSPYAKLVEELRALEDVPEEEQVKKTTQILNARFTATIKTRKELVAVIDSRLYRKGDRFQDKEITDIKPEIVSLDSPSNLFLIPKVGVEVSIDPESGTFSYIDSYKKN